MPPVSYVADAAVLKCPPQDTNPLKNLENIYDPSNKRARSHSKWKQCIGVDQHIYIYTYIHTYIHTYVRTYVQTDRQTDRHARIHTYAHARARADRKPYCVII